MYVITTHFGAEYVPGTSTMRVLEGRIWRPSTRTAVEGQDLGEINLLTEIQLDDFAVFQRVSEGP